MDKLDVNKILHRKDIEKQILTFLDNFDNTNTTKTRGLYLYGCSGIGKTYFVKKLLHDKYDIISYNAGDIRNKNIIDTITINNMSDTNVISMFQKKKKKIVILMDEIDGMNNGDKGGINSLIKLIRPKKTKKQKLEAMSGMPIICIGNYHLDKKIKELMKVCYTIEIKKPTYDQIHYMMRILVPSVKIKMLETLIKYIDGDLRKVNTIVELFKQKDKKLIEYMINDVFQKKSYNQNTKEIAKNLINKPYHISDHNNIINETDRTIVALLWHENIVDIFGDLKKDEVVDIYRKILDNFCFADYIDRITFQKQIWVFNEMSSLIKTFQNNKIISESNIKKKITVAEPRFTKVLTKYSTEYNNYQFLQKLSQKLLMDTKDMKDFFLYLKKNYSDEEIFEKLENYEISQLDINRIYRFLDEDNNTILNS